MTEEDAASSPRRAAAPFEETGARRLAVPAAARRARPRGLRLVLQRRLEPDALVPPALPVGPRRRAERRPGARTTRGRRATSPSTRRSPRPSSPSSRPSPTRRVFFHDYHLYLAPRFVRERRPDATLAHFVHIPWPQPDYWHVLPRLDPRARVHDGLLANDIVGFHTHRWRRNFLRSCRRPRRRASATSSAGSSSYDGRETLVSCHPISVDPARVRGAGDERGRARRRSRRSSTRRPEFLVLRVDRTDPSKNVVRGFRAFERYLDDHPEMHGRVGMLALLDPSRQDIPEYAEYLGAIQRDGARRQRPLPARRAGRRSTSRSRTTSRSRSRRTSSTTCCS